MNVQIALESVGREKGKDVKEREGGKREEGEGGRRREKRVRGSVCERGGDGERESEIESESESER